ncbi:retinoblastoma-related protein-like isoform X1 [Cucurbita moschata]|uniref:Retinoblastoma-related protein-like isoform X1 n=1 Tax=Cucurbita moschata TaxID=3662 RepID=A0A6J1G115_CUCMO|nr:retinoblastoma-related protein-like isoform X1 [Cucurbita moschata]XP_022945472.1 retinoblastoma-related protein-like isoform X1 [Cucurbita moschata]XP_022945473.1 retinoblastoma-related protein-like isoform X1 [Cucurbita moschata]XP_022945474.1 retinoblastoma-related protein-like isoform X1 [Cucurbita moschata]
MEETKPSATNNCHTDGEPDTVEVQFTELCQNGLHLDESCCNQALKLFRETKHLLVANISAIGSGIPEEAERFWSAFVLYSVKRLRDKDPESSHSGPENNSFTLCHILRICKLNIVEFFKELPQFVVKAGPVLSNIYGADWENRLEAKELQANFVHLSLLSKYYKRVYQEFFSTSDANVDKQSAKSCHTGYLSDYHRFGWLLFLALRVHAFSRFKDLVTCTNGLVSILAILILHVPVRFRNFNILDSERFVKKGGKGVDLHRSLCNVYDTSEEELREVMEKANSLIEDILKKKPCLASECNSKSLENIDTEGLIYFEDLMEESSLSSSLEILEKDYEDAIRNKGELDERVFVNDEDSLLGSGSLSAGAVTMSGIKRKFDSMGSPARMITSPMSPLRSPKHVNGTLNSGNAKLAATPVSTAMTTAKWLRTVISPLPARPSPEMERFLASCDRDVTNDVVRRAHIILEAIFPNSALGERCIPGNLQSANLMDNIWAEQRRLEALKLYYRVLEAMCRAESQMLHVTNLTSLLTNERFHRCMLACSAELVLATHKTVTMLFPAVLERTGITAFDLSKVIESFIRHEESLPRELRRHLNSLEERLLESMVWEKGSSMYNSLIVAKPSLAAEINRMGLLAEPMPSLDAIAVQINFSGSGVSTMLIPQKHESLPGQNGDIRSPKRSCTDLRSVLVERNSFTSPVKDRLLAFSNIKSKLLPPPLQSAFASPTRPNPGGGGETCAETGISIFFSKIVKLAAVRVNGMVERLQLSHQIRENVYCLFQQILSQKASLLFNRHIDQIILCCFYGVAKISQLSLTFREIIYNYRKQPQCKPQVFRNVFVDWSSARRNGRSGQDHVDIITFYNEIFIPSVKPLLVEIGPAVSTMKTDRVPQVINNSDAPCPGSPKISPFPSLPDMSPKKVSSAHNVYVSPLRSSKMDALISHSSKSYYACVGESTHAFQSPSKDLTAINNRLNGLNGTRKLRGTLNFDDADVGLVSDSLVANSLYLQNGSCGSSSGAPIKSEQPDS